MSKNYNFYVYIMANINGVLHIGITNNLERRVYEYKKEIFSGFSEKYKCKKLVYCEDFRYIQEAISREKQLKGWNRNKKDNLIKRDSPNFNNLNEKWFNI